MPVVPATWEAEVGGWRSEVRPGKSTSTNLKKTKQKGLVEWLKWQNLPSKLETFSLIPSMRGEKKKKKEPHKKRKKKKKETAHLTPPIIPPNSF
jgi:hypothetical protein